MTRSEAGGLRVLRWEEPPPARAGTHSKRVTQYDKVALELIQRPGESAVVWEGNAGSMAGAVTLINEGFYSAFRPAGSFRAESRVKDGKRTLYVKYVGTPDADHGLGYTLIKVRAAWAMMKRSRDLWRKRAIDMGWRP